MLVAAGLWSLLGRQKSESESPLSQLLLIFLPLSLPLVPSASCCLNMVLCAGRCCCRCRIIYTLICSFCEHSGRNSLRDKTPRLIKSSRPQALFWLCHETQTVAHPSTDAICIYIYDATRKSYLATNCCFLFVRGCISLIFMIVFLYSLCSHFC